MLNASGEDQCVSATNDLCTINAVQSLTDCSRSTSGCGENNRPHRLGTHVLAKQLGVYRGIFFSFDPPSMCRLIDRQSVFCAAFEQCPHTWPPLENLPRILQSELIFDPFNTEHRALPEAES